MNQNDQNMIFERLSFIIEENLLLDSGDVTLDARLIDDLDIDSLCFIEIVTEAEAMFDIRLDDSRLAELITVGDMVAYITEFLQAKKKEKEEV